MGEDVKRDAAGPLVKREKSAHFSGERYAVPFHFSPELRSSESRFTLFMSPVL
jgi:hypothetical protein